MQSEDDLSIDQMHELLMQRRFVEVVELCRKHGQFLKEFRKMKWQGVVSEVSPRKNDVIRFFGAGRREVRGGAHDCYRQEVGVVCGAAERVRGARLRGQR